MAQRDSELVVRLRDEASKTFEAIKKAQADFAAGLTDAAKTSAQAGGTFQRLAQSIVDLGKSAVALGGVSKISDQLAKATGAVDSLEKKLATASTEFSQFQARAAEAATAAAAMADRAKAAAAAETAQEKALAGLNAANKANTRSVTDAETALEKLNARLAKVKGGSDAMVAEAQKQTAALETLRAKQAQSQAAYDAEKEKLGALTAARQEATKAQGAADSAQNKANASLKTATGNVDSLTAGLQIARGGLAEIQSTFEASAAKVGLMSASIGALSEAETKLKTLTEAASAALRAQSEVSGPKVAAAAVAQVSAFQGGLAREAARRAAVAAQAAAPAAPRSADEVRLVASAPAAENAAAFRAQQQAVEAAGAAYRTAAADYGRMRSAMALTKDATIEQTAALETQRVVMETARQAQQREIAQLDAFRAAVRAAAQARQADALATTQEAAERENAARDATARQVAEAARQAELARVELARRAADVTATKAVADRQAAEDQARARAATVVGAVGAGGQLSVSHGITEAFREQRIIVDQARAAYATAQEQLDAVQRTMAGVTGRTKEQTAALGAQKAQTDALQAALERETVALRAISSAIDQARGREATQTTQRVQAVLTGVAAPSARAVSTPIAGGPAPDPDVALRARAAAAAAYREQVTAAAAATRAYEGQQAALAALAGAMSTTAKATAEETAAVADQRAAVATAESAMNREIAALREMKDAISATAAARRAGVSAEIIAAGAMSEIRAATARATAGTAEQVSILGALRNALLQANAASREYRNAQAEIGDSHNALAGGIRNLIGAYVNVFLAADAFRKLISSAVDTEAAQVRITTALGQGQEAGAAAFEHAANAARALKIDILPAVDAYGKFLGVVRDTPLEGRNATRVFDDLLVTIRAFKLAPENMTRVIQALTDIAARGHVATREMNQLDLALPVGLRQAIQTAAGFTGGANSAEEFVKALRAGKVALDTLPAAFDIVAAKARAGLPEALKTAQSSFAEFRNVIYDFGVAISQGDFMKGIVDGVNAITAVLKDPQAAQGLHGIANGFGEILSIIASLLPQARVFVIALSGLTAIKLVSMVATFASIRAAIVAVIDSFLAWRAAIALLGASAILPGIAAQLSALVPLLLGPAGIIALVGLVGAGIAYWLTGTKDAEAALNSYKRTVSGIADSLRQSGGDFSKLGQGDASIQVSSIEQQLVTQQQAFKDTGSALNNYINRLGVLNSVMGDSAQAREVGRVVELGKAYANGSIPVQDFQARVEALNKTLSTDEGKMRAAELSKLAGAHKDASDMVDVLRGTLVKNGATLVLTEAQMLRAVDAANALRREVLRTAEGFKNEGVAGFEAYIKALEDLESKIPGLKEKLDMRNEIADARKTLAAGLAGIQAELGPALDRGGGQMISEQQAAARRKKLIDDEALFEADLRAKQFRKEATIPEETTNAYKFLQENAKPGADVTGLHPELATGLTDAIKELQKEGINLKVESGALPGGDTKAAVESSAALIKSFEGFIDRAKIDSDGKFRVGFGSDTTTDASGRVSAVTADTITTQEDAQRDLARRVVEFQTIAAKSIGEAWSGLSDQVKASITSVTYNYGHVPDTVAAAAKTGDNITISEAIAALKSNPARRAEEAANVTAVPLSALGSNAPTIQNFGGGAKIEGITDENAQKVADALAKHGIFIPNEDNVAQLGPTPLAESPGLLNALQAAKRSGDQAAVFREISPPGANKKATDSAERDASKDRNDLSAEQDAIEKNLAAENEQLAITRARSSVIIGMADFQKAHPNATGEELAAEKQLLIAKQQQMEIDAADDKFQDTYKNVTDAQFEQFHNNQVEQHSLAQQAAQDTAAARDARHEAIQGQEKLNALLTERRGLLKDLTTANETGDETKIDTINSALSNNKSQFDQTAESVRKFWGEVGGTDADTGIAKLNRTVEAAGRTQSKFQILGLSTKETQEVVRDFANDISSAIDTFAQEVANGVKPIQALGDAFRKFASDFLLQIAKMIIQTQIFKLLGITQSGETTGGGLLGGLLGGGGGAASGASGGGILSFLGSLFGAHHTGGVVGSPTMFRNVSPLVFANARRYHTGGLAGLSPNEIPIIAKKNEEILTEDDPRHRNNSNAGMAINNIIKQPRIINAFDAPSFLSAALGAPEGEDAIMNFVRANAGAFKSAIGG